MKLSKISTWREEPSLLIYLLIYLFVCICMYALCGVHVCVYACAEVCVCVCVCRISGAIVSLTSLAPVSSSFPDWSSVSQRYLPTSVSPVLVLQGMMCVIMPGCILHAFWVLNLVPHAWISSILPTEQFSHFFS